MAKQTPAMIPMMGEEAVVTKGFVVNFVICQHQKEPLFPQYFFPLMVTRGIPPVSRNNDTIKRLSYVKYFS